MNLQTMRAIGLGVRGGAARSIRSAGLILRDAIRALRAAPAHSLVIILVLATGVTAGTVTFSVVDAVVLRPLPLEQPEQLVSIPTRDRDFTERITAEMYWRLHDHLGTVEGLAARSTLSGSSVQIGQMSDEWPITFATSDIFTVLRWTPALGRFWTADDEARGQTSVAVLGYRFWRQHFNGDPSVLRQTVTHGKRSYQVIGVLPVASDHPELDLTSYPIWVPMVMPRTGRANPFGLLARMKPGVSNTQVADEIARLAAIPNWRPDVRPLLSTYVEPVQRWMLLALGASALVVLIACVNAANLMLTRSARRTREMAIRASLGASRRQIATTVLAEGCVLSLAATACALALSTAGVQIAKAAITTMLFGVFRASTIALDGRVLAVAAAAAAITGLLVSLVPAWQTARAPVSSLLKDGEGTTATGRGRWRGLLLTAEIATVAVLLVVSWLFVVSLIRVVGIDLGIDRTNLLAVRSRLPFRGTVDEVQARIERVPGVSGVAVTIGAGLPLVGRAFGGAWITTEMHRADGTRPGRESPVTVLQYRVTPNYFDVAGVRFARGAGWSATTAFNPPSVVLDEQAARRLFGNDDPVGRQVRAEVGVEPEQVFTVVGVVPHVYARGPEEPNLPAAYFALRPSATRVFAALFVRTSRPADEMLPILTEVLKNYAPRTRDPFVYSADDAVRRITATRRFNAGFMSAFGIVGMMIAAAGVYAVMASFVAQQTRDIGVRVALGATPARIRRDVLAVAWRHLLLGLALGLPIAWWLSRGFASLLFQVTPADASVYVGVAGILIVVGLTAAWIPARRAARIDPTLTLRR